MPTIDAQVHAYERNHPGRPWAGHLAGPPEVTGDQMVEAMDEVNSEASRLEKDVVAMEVEWEVENELAALKKKVGGDQTV